MFKHASITYKLKKAQQGICIFQTFAIISSNLENFRFGRLFTTLITLLIVTCIPTCEHNIMKTFQNIYLNIIVISRTVI